MNMILSAKLFLSLCRLLRLNPRARGSILPARFREMAVLLTSFMHGEYGFSSVRTGAILGNGCGIQGQDYVPLVQGSEITAGFRYRNWDM